MKKEFRTDLAKVKGLGSAKSGAHHWWHQRLTSLFLLPLLIWFLFFIKYAINNDLSTIITLIQKPYNIIPILLFITISMYHSMLGLRVVIEDYISSALTRHFLIITMQIFCITTIVTAIVTLFTLMIL